MDFSVFLILICILKYKKFFCILIEIINTQMT